MAAALMAAVWGLQAVWDNASVFDLTLFSCSLFIPEDFRIYVSDETGSSMADLTHIKVSLGCYYLVTST